MNDPHDKNNYSKIDDGKNAECTDDDRADPTVTASPKRRKTLSGAYYYVELDEKKLAESSFIRTVLTVIAFMLQIVIMLLPQGSLGYVTEHFPSFAYSYAIFTVIGMLGVSIWLMPMNILRYKFAKRIPAERAPRGGFAKRAYFGAELYIAVTSVMFIFELSFVCIHYDHVGLAGMFISALSVAAAVWARQVTHLTLKNSKLISAPDLQNENSANDGDL